MYINIYYDKKLLKEKILIGYIIEYLNNIYGSDHLALEIELDIKN